MERKNSFTLLQPNQRKPKDQARGISSRDTTSNQHTQYQTEGSTKHNNLEFSVIDHVSSNAKQSGSSALL